MIFFLDNYDSFTYNLAQYVGMLEPDIKVVRNDQISVDEVLRMDPRGIIISPGPKTPKEAGISKELIKQAMGNIPLLGICLGHQAIGEILGANTIQAKEIVHGKSCQVIHNQKDILRDIPSPLEAGRYHSLVIDPDTITDKIEVIATTDQTSKAHEKTIMGIKAKEHKNVWGLQFHPESILTKEGFQIIKNFINVTIEP